MSIRLLLVDDHRLFLDGVRDRIARELDIELVGIAGSGQEAIKIAERVRPNLAVLDFSMPDYNGIELAKQLWKVLPKIKIALLTMHLDKRIIAEALAVGMNGYILKETDMEDFLQALRTLNAGEVWLSPKVATQVVQSYRELLGENQHKQPSRLSPREEEVLRLLVLGKGCREIAEALHVSRSTADTHRRNILEKLDCDNIACLTRYALREGIVELE